MKSIKFLVVLVCMTLGMADVAKAQIYSNEVCYYRTTYNNAAYIVKFDGLNNRVIVLWKEHYKFVYKQNQTGLHESMDYFECEEAWNNALKHWESSGAQNGIYKGNDSFYVYVYDSQLSTSEREVYRGVYFPKTCLGFSKDKQTVSKYGLGHESNAQYWIRVSKEDFLPENVVPGFLNE